MSLIVAFLTADMASSDTAMNKDRWSRIAGQAAKVPTGCPSPFRASPRGRVTHLFGAN
jgi:hypothetical protein